MNIYGYWIDKDDVIDVPYCEHYETAREILRARFGDRYSRIHNSNWNIYRWMFRLGYVRVVNDRYDDDYGVQYYSGTKLSKLQKEFIKDASMVDKMTNPQECNSYSLMA